MKNVLIGNTELRVKMLHSERVISFKDIDAVHQRASGTAHRNFKANKEHLIENEDYFRIKPCDILKDENRLLGFEDENPSNRGTIYLTETGYLMLVKSFTDDLAWDVQRKLVNSYFKLKEIAPQTNEIQSIQKDLSVMFVQVNNVEETLGRQTEQLAMVMDNMTLSTRQQQKINKVAKDRVNKLLGGAHSTLYKQESRSYFINLWNDFKNRFTCGSYKDLNPTYYNEALDWIAEWEYYTEY